MALLAVSFNTPPIVDPIGDESVPLGRTPLAAAPFSTSNRAQASHRAVMAPEIAAPPRLPADTPMLKRYCIASRSPVAAAPAIRRGSAVAIRGVHVRAAGK